MGFTYKELGARCIIIAVLLAGLGKANAEEGISSANVDIVVAIKAKTCTAGWAGKGATVDFGKVSIHDIPFIGDVLPDSPAKKTFSLFLTNCDATVSKVIVTASGPVDHWSDYFANNGTATGVAIVVQDAESNVRLINGKSIEFNVVDNAAEMKFSAGLVNNKSGLSPGTISSVVTLNMTYE